MYCWVVGIIPQSWRRYTVPQGITVIQWITDFSLRVKQLQAIVQTTQQGGTKELKVWVITGVNIMSQGHGSLQGSTSGHYRCQHFGHYTSNIIKGHYRGQLQYHMNLYGHYRGSKSSHLINMYMYMKISEMLDIHEDSTSGSCCCAVWPR